MDLQLKDKTALVSGGTRGIGQAIVQALLAEGAKVASVDREDSVGREWEQSCRARGEQALLIPGDLTESETCENAIAQTVSQFGGIDILINNAGNNDGVGLAAGPDAFVSSLHNNLGHYYALAHYARHELAQSKGCIVNIGSKVSYTGQGGTSGYAASKGGVNALTREWALELAPQGVRVNAVLPAEVWTPLYERCLGEAPDPAAARREIEQLIPLGRRFTTAQEIASTVTFLASPRSSHTTGQILFVDGGYTHLDRKA